VAHNSEAFPAQAGRWLRHGILYAGAEALDIISRSHQGTEAAMRFMERPYGDKQVAVLPAPPSWRAAQAHAGIEHTTSPHKVLVRGRGLNTELPLRGIYPTSSLHHK